MTRRTPNDYSRNRFKWTANERTGLRRLWFDRAWSVADIAQTMRRNALAIEHEAANLDLPPKSRRYAVRVR
jgi:hypothetical protein